MRDSNASKPKPKHGHKWAKCTRPCAGCFLCEGGLSLCKVCGAGEGQLLNTCPGYRLNEEALDACYRGNVKDFQAYQHAIEHGAKIRNGQVVWPNQG